MQPIGQTRSSTLLVLVVTLLAVSGGLLFGSRTLSRTRTVTQSGISLDIPVAWLASAGSDGELLTANDIRRSQQKATVIALPASSSLSDAAALRMLNRARGMNSFRVLEQGMVDLNGTPAYSVHYAHVIASPNTMPRVIEGMDYYIDSGNRVLVVSFEDVSDSFLASLATFERMATSLRAAEPGE
jgi:hypothetical protein